MSLYFTCNSINFTKNQRGFVVIKIRFFLRRKILLCIWKNSGITCKCQCQFLNSYVMYYATKSKCMPSGNTVWNSLENVSFEHLLQKYFNFSSKITKKSYLIFGTKIEKRHFWPIFIHYGYSTQNVSYFTTSRKFFYDFFLTFSVKLSIIKILRCIMHYFIANAWTNTHNLKSPFFVQ